MTEEFELKMNEAINNGVMKIQKRDDEIKYKANKKWADLYMDLVIATIEVFDYKDGYFNTKLIDSEFMKKFGKPADIGASIDWDENKVHIMIYYCFPNGPGRKGDPAFKSNKNFDLDMINEILEENGISVEEHHTNDYDALSMEEDSVYFDATPLLAAWDKVIEEKAKVKEKNKKQS